MKIVFINITDTGGGAGKAMYRLGKALERIYKTENLFLVRSKVTNDKNIIQVGSKFLRIINILFNLIGLQYKFLPNSIVRKAREFKPDVISLNQVEGGYFQTRDIIKLSKIAPIFWTFHDMWAFTGSASNTFGDESFRQMESFKGENKIYPHTGFNNGRWLLKQKKKIYSKTRFTIISPSQWIYRQSIGSPVLPKTNFVIPNGVDGRYSPGVAKNILFVSEKVSKGDFSFLKYLDEILDFKVQLIVIGKGAVKGNYKNIIITNKGYLDNEDDLIFFYRLADVLVHPSRADNCPLTILEAANCGTPTVGYDVGGVGELTIYTFKNPSQFALMVKVLLTSKQTYPVIKSDINKTAKKYYEVFTKGS